MLEQRYPVAHARQLMHIGSDGAPFSVRLYEKRAQRRTAHYHDFCELEYVLDGRADCVVNGLRIALKRGSFVLVRPTDIHRYDVPPGAPLRVISVRFSERMLSEAVLRAVCASGGVLRAQSTRAEPLLRSLLHESQQPDAWSIEVCRAALTALIVRLLRAAHSAPADDARDPRVRAAEQIIRLRCGEPLTLASVAAELHLSANHFGVLFRTEMEQPFRTFLQRVRLSAALNRILHSLDSVQAIALECGFSSQTTFARAFRAQYGVSPLEARRLGTI